MTVDELIHALNDLDPDALVVIQKDGEGNEYSPADGVGESLYVAETPWSGYTIDDEEPQEIDAPATKVIILWPKN
jgi:hypothetical protein